MHAAMASSSAVPAAAATAGSPSSAPSAWPSTLSKGSIGGHYRRRRRSVSCRATGADDGGEWSIPRRGVLAGLTGLAAYPDFAAALAAEAEATCLRGDTFTGEFFKCDRGNDLPCPPEPSSTTDSPKQEKPDDFKAPPDGAKLRVRRPAHIDQTSMEKYKEALTIMKGLPASDPRSFTQQAGIHQAYCDGHYKVAEATGDPADKDAPFDVHFSWVFAPWHRMYIYFYERILGDLIGDDDFALPYWNWDAPEGMALPKMFKEDPTSPLYDEHRNPAHLNATVDLDFVNNKKAGKTTVVPFDPKAEQYNDRVDKNIATVYRQMMRKGEEEGSLIGIDAPTFLGGKVCAGNKYDRSSGTSGTLESLAHTSIHVWTGNPEYKVKGRDGKDHANGDMGFLGSASRDPIFYSHHANVDRLWHLWSTELGGQNLTDPEWLDTSFVFYDEKKRLVRCKVRDFLDTAKLGYAYDYDEKVKDNEKSESPPLLWRNYKPTVRQAEVPLNPVQAVTSLLFTVPPPKFPLKLREGESVVVPGVAQPRRGKGETEVLVIDGVEFNPGESAKFDVAINVPREVAGGVGPRCVEYAGSFASLPRGGDDKPGATRKVPLKIPLDDVLADVGVGTEEAVNVVIVPRTSGVTISEPRIETRDRS